MKRTLAFGLVALFLVSTMPAQAGTAEYPEWKDPMLDNRHLCWGVCDPTRTPWLNPFMDVTGGWAEVWADDSFDATMTLGVVPPMPGIGVPGTGLTYVYYWLYTVNDPVGQRPNYPDYPPAGGAWISSFVQATWWDRDGPGDDPIWLFQWGYEYFDPPFYTFVSPGDVVGKIDLIAQEIQWTVGRGLPQTLIPQGCNAEGWSLTRLHGLTTWFATAAGTGVGLYEGPMEDRGPNAGFGRPYEFPECPGQEFKTGEETTEFSVSMGNSEIAAKRLEFADPFNGTHFFKWNSTSENVTISWDAIVQEGNVQLYVQDASGETILDAFMAETTDGSSTVRGAVPGEWKIFLDFDFFTREIGFEIVDAAKYQKQESGRVGGEATNGAEPQEPTEETGEGGSQSNGEENVDLGGSNNLNNAADRDSPGVGLLATLALLGAVFYLRRK